MGTWEGKVRIGKGREEGREGGREGGRGRVEVNKDEISSCKWLGLVKTCQIKSIQVTQIMSCQVKVGKSSRFKLDRIG